MRNSLRPAAFITGAARGIGRGIAARLLSAGWNVLLADVLAGEGKKAAVTLNREFCHAGGRAVFARCDVSEEKQVAEAVARSIGEFGRLDALVNNAGIADARNAPVEKLTLADWNRRISVNLTGAFLCAKHAAPHLRRRRGAIVNISSTRALQSEPHNEAYCASKAGMLGLTRALAISLGPKIRVNAICPGWIDTRALAVSAARAKTEKHDQHPVGRVGHPGDIAELALFLLESRRSGFITGQTFVCDGGMTVKMIYEE